MEMPLISIIIPVYNHADILVRSLKTLVAQTYRPLEVIIVDDGSVSPIAMYREDIFALGFCDRSDTPQTSGSIPILLLRQENKGAPAARNLGTKHARGEYYLYWDADIFATTEMITRLFAALESTKTAAFAYGNLSIGAKKMPARAYDIAALQKQNFIAIAALIRRSAAVPFDETLTRFQDWDMWLTMAEQGKTGVWVDKYLYRVETRGSTMSAWLPSFAYRVPWKYCPWWYHTVRRYEKAKKIVEKKHHKCI